MLVVDDDNFSLCNTWQISLYIFLKGSRHFNGWKRQRAILKKKSATGGVVCPVLNCRTNGNRKLNERLQNMKDGNYFMRNKMAFSSLLPRTMDALNCSDCNLKYWTAGTARNEREQVRKRRKSEWTMTTDSLKIRNILHTHTHWSQKLFNNF